MYVNRVVEYILKYANELDNKIDAIIFTAGVGENSIFAVEHIVRGVKLLHLTVDSKNIGQKYADYKLISGNDSSIPIYCVRTDEELMIAQDVVANLK
jgi:acetate kinase